MKVFGFHVGSIVGLFLLSHFGFAEHRDSKKPARQKVASLAAQCTRTAFETQFGPELLENKKVVSGSLFPIAEVTETKYAISGSRGAAPPTTYQATVGWRYTAPTDSAFRSAVAQAFLCSGEGHTDAFKTLNALLDQEELFQQFQPVRGALQKNKNPHAQEEDLLRLRKMRSLLQELSRLLADSQRNSEIKDFVRALFKQIELNERTLPNPLSVHEDLLKQLKRIQSGEPESLRTFAALLSEHPEFDYWIHPIIGNYVRAALSPSFKLDGEQMAGPQGKDLSAALRKTLGASTFESLVDSGLTQGKTTVHSTDHGKEARVEAASTEERFQKDLAAFVQSLGNSPEHQQKAAVQQAIQSLARAVNGYTGGTDSFSPQHLALRDAARKAVLALSPKDPTAADVIDSKSEQARSKNAADYHVLSPLRTKLEKELPQSKFPISARAIENVSNYPAALQRVLNGLTNDISPKKLSGESLEALESFLQTGSTSDLMEVLFKDRAAFDAAVNALSQMGVSSKATQLLRGFPKEFASEYAEVRNQLKRKALELGQDSAKSQERDAHLLALALLDEMGLEGVTDRDLKTSDFAYHPEALLGTLREEASQMEALCQGKSDPQCMEKLERELEKNVQRFLGTSTGIPSHLRQRLFERGAISDPKATAALARLDAILPKNSKLRQAYFFADAEHLASTGASHLRPVSPIERAARMGTETAPDGLSPEERARLQELFPKLQAQRREASKTASELAQLLVPLLAQLESTALGLEDPDQRAAIHNFLGCLQSALVSQTPSHSNVLAMRKLYLWLKEEGADSELRESRLNFFSDQFGCSGAGISPDSLGWTSSSFDKPARVDALGERLVRQLSDETKLLEETDPLWTSAEAALIESDNLDRIREAQAREGALGGAAARQSPLMRSLRAEESASQKRLAELGLSSDTATPDSTPSLTAQDIQRLEQNHNIVYDPIRNALIITQQSKLDAQLLDLLSRAKNIDLIFQGAHASEELVIPDGANASSFLGFLARAGTQLGASPMTTSLTWEQIRALDTRNPDGIPTPVWFPLTDETAVRMKLSPDGKLTAEFSPVQKLAADARKKVDAIIEARSRSYLAQHNYQGTGHALKSYFGAMAGWDPSKTSEVQELQASYNDYVQLRQALGQLGKIPVANGQGLTAEQFRGNELHEMRRLLNQEEEAIHKLLSKVETIHSLSVMVATLPLGTVSLPAKLVGPLSNIAQGTGRAAFAARNTLRTLQALNALKNGYVAATKHGLITSTAFSGIDLVAEGIIHSFPNSTHHLIEEKIVLGRKGASWKKYPEHPGSDPKWGPRDSQGLPTDPEKRKSFLQAMFEFELEQSLDIDHNGVIDEIQGLHGEAVPFSRKRGFSSIASFDRVQQFTDSAKFFRDLSLAKLPGPRFVALPLEMGFAGTLGEVAGTVHVPGLGQQQISDFGFGRSRDSLRHEEKFREGGPRTDTQRLKEALFHNMVEGARFGLAGASSNALMRTLGKTTPSAANILMGTLLFTGIDATTRAGVSQGLNGYTGTEAANWEEWFRQVIQHNATSMYIGLSITQSGMQRADHRRLQEVYLSGGAEALRASLREQARKSKSDPRTLLGQLFKKGGDPQKAEVDPRAETELMASIIASIRPQVLAQAAPEIHRGYEEFVETRLREANERFQEVVRSGSVISPEGARRLVEINEALLQISREGAWNHSKRSAALLREQDSLFKELNTQLEREHAALRAATLNLQRLAGSETPERIAEYQQQKARFEGIVNLIGGLSETIPQMAAARSLVTPALTMGAVTQPSSAFAQQHFSNKPAALQALQSFERSARQQVRTAAQRVTQFLAEEHILPDFGRASDGQGGAARFTGARPTQGVNGRAQRESAELVERVLRAKTTSQQAKRELIVILEELDPQRASVLAEEFFGGKPK